MKHFLIVIAVLFTSHSFVYGKNNVKFHFEAENSTTKALNDAEVEIKSSKTFTLYASDVVEDDVNITFVYELDNGTDSSTVDQIKLSVSQSTYHSNSSTTWLITVTGHNPGHVTLVLKNITDGTNTTAYDVTEAFIRFQIFHSEPLNIVSEVIGWIYFVAWSVSFYPQVILNFRRKSVVGLNFDFLALNLAGFLCYAAYNIGLFWIPTVKDEFKADHPHDITPVEINDVVFAIHAAVLTIVTIVQVLIYERGGQSVSMVAKVILLACSTTVVIVIVLASIPAVTFNWLGMVQALSYVKLAITIVKYIPQAWMNFRRKSTVGWSIGNVLLDFTGGSGSIIQMFILAYNFNDWASIFLNPVKFWLGALSILFDIIFISQHYCLYRNKQPNSRYARMEEST